MWNQWIKILTLPFMVVCLLTTTACEKLDTPTPEKQTGETTNASNSDTPDTPIPETATELRTREDTIYYVESLGTTEEIPYSINDIRNIIPHYLDIYGAIQISNCYVGGFIVGYIPQHQQNISKTVFSAGSVNTNLVLADSPDEIDHKKCIAIQLTTSTPTQQEIREGLNLASHPENLGHYVIVQGNIKKYMSVMGVKEVKNAILFTEE